jgi:hypothetical protein
MNWRPLVHMAFRGTDRRTWADQIYNEIHKSDERPQQYVCDPRGHAESPHGQIEAHHCNDGATTNRDDRSLKQKPGLDLRSAGALDGMGQAHGFEHPDEIPANVGLIPAKAQARGTRV